MAAKNSIPIFVVNLKNDTEKKRRILNNLQTLGLQAEVIEAVYGKDLTEAQLAELVYDHQNCCLTKGEIGCALSHLAIYKKMLEQDLPLALVLEDDAILQPQAREVLQEIAAADDNTRPAVYILSHVTDYLPLSGRKLQSCTLYKMYRGYNTFGYILNLAAVEKLYQLLLPVRFEADRWEYFKLILGLDIYCLSQHVIDDSDPQKITSSLERERGLIHRQRCRYRKQMLARKFPLLVFKRLFYRTLVRLFAKKN